jgi:hypothetical protein
MSYEQSSRSTAVESQMRSSAGYQLSALNASLVGCAERREMPGRRSRLGFGSSRPSAAGAIGPTSAFTPPAAW